MAEDGERMFGWGRKDRKRLSARLKALTRAMEREHLLHSEEYYRRILDTNPRYREPKRLLQHGFRTFSQNDEDGIIREIFHRIETADNFFVEFGVGDGRENNTLALLHRGWSGVWFEPEAATVAKIERRFAPLVEVNRLRPRRARLTVENAATTFAACQVATEFDLMSIDIDGNDYWVWRALRDYRPRVVVMEYNARFDPDTYWIMRYNPDHVWRATSYHGASLQALTQLGTDLGYKLVGCNFTGVNCFFVREDLVGDKFAAPFTAENHYEPARFDYVSLDVGGPRDFGDFCAAPPPPP